MFVLELSYTAPLDQVDALIPAHVVWLNGHYADGVFIASGRKEPRDGGMILAVADTRASIEDIVETDPFVTAGVCTYRVSEFIATKTSPALAPYRQTLPS